MIHPEGNMIYYFLAISIIIGIVLCIFGFGYLKWKKNKDKSDDFKQYD